jgi:hypothetical protein
VGENQTKDSDLIGVKPTDMGSGVFAIPDPLGGRDAFTKIIVNDITYQECVKRGRRCIAFKWVNKQLPTGETECPTPNMLCKETCAHDTCVCIDGLCQ